MGSFVLGNAVEGVQMINTDCVEVFEIEDKVYDQVMELVYYQVWEQGWSRVRVYMCREVFR